MPQPPNDHVTLGLTDVVHQACDDLRAAASPERLGVAVTGWHVIPGKPVRWKIPPYCYGF